MQTPTSPQIKSLGRNCPTWVTTYRCSSIKNVFYFNFVYCPSCRLCSVSAWSVSLCLCAVGFKLNNAKSFRKWIRGDPLTLCPDGLQTLTKCHSFGRKYRHFFKVTSCYFKILTSLNLGLKQKLGLRVRFFKFGGGFFQFSAGYVPMQTPPTLRFAPIVFNSPQL